MKNYRMPNMPIKQAYQVIERQKTMYRFIEGISKHPLFKVLAGSLDRPTITILNDVEVANKAIAGIVDTKNPQIIDCDLAVLETKYNKMIVVFANVAKPTSQDGEKINLWESIKKFFITLKTGGNFNVNIN